MTLPIFFAKINLGAHSQIPYLQGKWHGRFSNGQKLPFLIEHAFFLMGVQVGSVRYANAPYLYPHGGCSPRIESFERPWGFCWRADAIDAHEHGASVVASLLVLAILSKLCWVASLKDALRALGFDRAVRKLTLPALRLGKEDGTLLTRFAAATRCLCSLRSLGDCIGALWMRTRAHDTRTRARTLGLLINCSRKLKERVSKMLRFQNVTTFVT